MRNQMGIYSLKFSIWLMVVDWLVEPTNMEREPSSSGEIPCSKGGDLV